MPSPARPVPSRPHGRPVLHGLATDISGNALVEFAMVAPALLALIMGILQVSLIFLANEGLETVAEYAARVIMTGQAQSTAMSASAFKTQVCTQLPPFLACDRLFIDVSPATNFSNASLGAPTLTYANNGTVNTSFAYSTGSTGAIMVVRVLYLWPTAAGPLGFNLTNQPSGNRLLVATSVLKSE
jgi:Flp pilus assembly protein TadG